MTRRILLLLALFAATAVPAHAAGHDGDRKLDPALRARAHAGRGTSRIILQTVDGSPADSLIRAVSGTPGRRLPWAASQVAEIPDRALDTLADNPRISALALDRPVQGTIEQAPDTTGATWARANLGVDGSGVGVAIVDSGVTSWHDDLGSDRVVHFADFVSFQPLAYDDYGHGTHVAGIIAGSGYDSNGANRGMAPGANLIVLKVLDGDGNGYISNVIAALDYAVQNRTRFNIRVVNLSVAAGVYESYTTDPLALAARRAVEAGIVVVTAAGNFGQTARGQPQYGGITSPGNAPWVLTVGASTHNGTLTRADDQVAPFSSRGPSYIDRAAKPDLVAPGVGIASLSDASSLLFSTHPSGRSWGTVDTLTPPYLSLSGTSMAAPVVAGAVALMLDANPSLTPNLVKAILQYTADHRTGYDDLTQGAGFLNARGAVQLAKSLAGNPAAPPIAKDPTRWNSHINWGNHRVGGGALNPRANAWRTDVVWGASTTSDGARITWGAACSGIDCDDIIGGRLTDDRPTWGCADAACDRIVRGASIGDDAPNIVWGSGCTTADCGSAIGSSAALGAAAIRSSLGRPDVRGAACATSDRSCAAQPAESTGPAREPGNRRGGA
jgi:serine protease AprX